MLLTHGFVEKSPDGHFRLLTRSHRVLPGEFDAADSDGAGDEGFDIVGGWDSAD